MSISTIASTLSRIHWHWDRARWEAIAAELNLHLKEAVGGRQTYIWRDEAEVHAYLSKERLQGLEILLSFFFWDDFLEVDEEEEEAKTAEYEARFREVAEEVSRTIGPPQLDLHWEEPTYPQNESSARLAAWLVSGGRLVLRLYIGSETLPYRVSLFVEPPDGIR